MDKIIEQVQAEKAFLKEGTKMLKGDVFSEDDRKFFQDSKKANLAAEALVDDDEKKVLLLVQYSTLSNKLAFLLFRKKALTKELEKQFFALPSIDDVAELYRKYETEHEAKRKEIQALIDADRAKDHKLDVFKGVLNGMTVEQAEEGLKRYEAQAAQAMGTQGK